MKDICCPGPDQRLKKINWRQMQSRKQNAGHLAAAKGTRYQPKSQHHKEFGDQDN